MTTSLGGRVVGLTEARRARELAALITKLGGVPYSAPAVREVLRADRGPALAVLDEILRGDVAAIVFLTGVGTRAVLDLAAETGARDRLVAALSGMTVAARGPKPLVVLREAGVGVNVVPSEPTSQSLVHALAGRGLEGKAVAVQLYGDDNPVLIDGLTALGARVRELPLYEWALPEDVTPLRGLIQELVARRIDVLAFTSSPQVRHLFAFARSLGQCDALGEALRHRVIVASIGPVCDAALAAEDVTPAVRAPKGTMGALVHAIAEHLASSSSAR
jgi:uroporphyrinogen-III synthase